MAEKNKICHLCGGELEPYGIGKLKCKYCDTIYEEEVINGEEGVLLVNAYKSLRDGETDEAYKAFIDIIDRAPKCYEACLGVALANHGIVYVDDNRSGKRKRVPTCYNTTLTPFREDSYYQTAVKLAPDDIAAKYEKDAEEIDRIRELWLEKAEKEKPYDIFISYKESDDETKQRTADSVQAQELYTWLTDQGYRVFSAGPVWRARFPNSTSRTYTTPCARPRSWSFTRRKRNISIRTGCVTSGGAGGRGSTAATNIRSPSSWRTRT